MNELTTTNMYNALINNIEDDSYKREIKFHNNSIYDTYCIYNDNKIECTVFKDHKRIIEINVILDLLKENYINVEAKLVKIRNKNEVQYVIRNMIKPLVQKLLA